MSCDKKIISSAVDMDSMAQEAYGQEYRDLDSAQQIHLAGRAAHAACDQSGQQHADRVADHDVEHVKAHTCGGGGGGGGPAFAAEVQQTVTSSAKFVPLNTIGDNVVMTGNAGPTAS